jgi:Transposase DDE domain
MLLSSVFEPFLAKRPLCVMARGVLQHLLEPGHVDRLFANTAQRGYQKELLFSTLTDLFSEVVLRVEPSVHAAYQRREGELGVSVAALYKKLNGIEPVVSAALVSDSAQRAQNIIAAMKAANPPWLRGYRARVLDGNHLGATEHRIEELRTTWAAPLPGRALVVLDPQWMLATHAFLTKDGHASERTLLDEVLQTVEARDVWIADRNFCTLGFLFGIARRLGFFVIRQHGCLKGTLIGERKRCGRIHTGVVYEQKIQLTDPETGETRTWRRITVELKTPTRDGDRELHILTNLPADAADAATVCELYRKRWTLETVFQEITTTLDCEVPSLGYPPAALFAFCLALLAYNAVSVLKAALRVTHGAKKVTNEVSGYYIALEIRQAYDGMSVVIADEQWEPFATATAEEMAAWLRRVAGGIDLARYRKHKRGPKKPPPKKSKYKNGGHVSTEKLLRERQRKRRTQAR